MTCGVRTQATGVELRKVIESLAVMPSNGISGTWPGWPQTDEAAVLDPEASEYAPDIIAARSMRSF